MSFTGDNVAGVGGWLAFLMLTLAVFTPLYMVFGTYSDLYGDPFLPAAVGSQWGMIQGVIWGAVAVALAICWFLTYRLNKVENWNTVRLTIAGLWTLAVGLPLLQVLLLSATTGAPISMIFQAAPFEFIRPPVVAAAWTAYLLMSLRVSNTYRAQPEYEDYAQSAA